MSDDGNYAISAACTHQRVGVTHGFSICASKCRVCTAAAGVHVRWNRLQYRGPRPEHAKMVNASSEQLGSEGV